MAFHPYLMFGGNCREAFTRYQEIFGGELMMMPFSDVPGDAAPAGQGELLAHAALMDDGNLLMGSDDPTGGFVAAQDMNVNYAAPDAAEAKRVFDALAEGGQVTMPLAEAFFSPAFGMCVDRFGTPWMITADQPEGQG